tara:strand:- start:4513 stop:4932 length:420 start_codon:yes stop_codon:yes gene_type:complete
MRREVLLEVKVSNHNVGWRREKVAECVVEDDLTAVVRVLETLLSDVLVNELGHFRARNELTFGKFKESAQLRRHILLTIEAVVGSTSLSLLTIWVFLGVLNLANKLGKVLDVVAESGDFGLDGFERHYIFLTRVTFKSV